MNEKNKWIEYNANYALARLDFAIQMTKDEGNKPEIMIFANECGLEINKTIARRYIKRSFRNMDSSHMRDASYVKSAESTFSIHKTDYGTIWVDASLEQTRTEENNAKHAELQIHRDAIWNQDEEE